ncbi:MAG TPA: LCP family protein [Leifsonia sp.]
MTVVTPLRHPDVTSARVMTMRAWWLVAVNVLLPGTAQLVAGDRRLGRTGVLATLSLWLVGLGLGAVYLVAPSAVYTLFTQTGSLTLAQVVLIAYAVLWVILTLDTLRLVRLVKTRPNARGWIAAFAVLVLVGITGTAGYASVVAGSARGALGDIFSAGPSQPPVDGRYNIMLLGGDAGPDRQGLRPDSMSVVSVDAATGRAVTIGLPRDLDPVPFPAASPLHALYPDGYGAHGRCDVDVCQLNSVYTEVELYKAKLYPAAAKHNSEPGVEAMRDALEGATGLTIQYYVLIDMQGFADLIDALGGVDVTVSERIPIGGDENLNGVVEWIQPGERHLDGYHAQWYARARHGTSDYDRMARQRQLQDAILRQMNPVNVVGKFQSIATAGTQVMKTDIPQSMLGYFVDLGMKTKRLPVAQLELVPPTIDPEHPDYAQIHRLVKQALTQKTP